MEIREHIASIVPTEILKKRIRDKVLKNKKRGRLGFSSCRAFCSCRISARERGDTQRLKNKRKKQEKGTRKKRKFGIF